MPVLRYEKLRGYENHHHPKRPRFVLFISLIFAYFNTKTYFFKKINIKRFCLISYCVTMSFPTLYSNFCHHKTQNAIYHRQPPIASLYTCTCAISTTYTYSYIQNNQFCVEVEDFSQLKVI